MSRDVFRSFDNETKPWTSPKPLGSVFSRLFEDFSRRQEAKERLVKIIDIKTRKSLKDSLHIPNFNEKKLNRSLSKPEFKQMVTRLNGFWEQKWKNIEKKKKLRKDEEERELSKTVRVKAAYKSNPEVFNRLTTSRKVNFAVTEPDEKKKFSIREAIESGKRLMHSKRFSINEKTMQSISNCSNGFIGSDTSGKFNGTYTPRVNNSPARMLRLEDSEPKRPSTRKEEVRNIEEIIQRCKHKALSLNFNTKGLAQFEVSETHGLSLLPAKK